MVADFLHCTIALEYQIWHIYVLHEQLEYILWVCKEKQTTGNQRDLFNTHSHTRADKDSTLHMELNTILVEGRVEIMLKDYFTLWLGIFPCIWHFLREWNPDIRKRLFAHWKCNISFGFPILECVLLWSCHPDKMATLRRCYMPVTDNFSWTSGANVWRTSQGKTEEVADEQ